MRAELLKNELQIYTFEDLLYHFPFRYIDRSVWHKIQDLDGNQPYIQIKGILGKIEQTGKDKGKRLTALFKDESGYCDLVWFQGQKWVKENLKAGKEYIVFGKPNLFKNQISFVHPEMETTDQEKKHQGFQPVYNVTERLKTKNITSRTIHQFISSLINHPNFEVPEILPKSLLDAHKLIGRKAAFTNIHIPKDNQSRISAENRIKFEELFLLQMRIVRIKNRNKRTLKGIRFAVVGEYFNKYYKDVLSFELTDAQKKVIKEIRQDTQTGRQMNRLLQGDVGSGKSVVALLNMLIAADNGTQSSLMAPTEILASQHFNNMHTEMEKVGLQCALLTGSTKSAERKRIHEGLENGTIQILIGTHALIEDKVKMKRQGLVIIDEQHRFGVAQRARMWDKSEEVPHILVMTATPIPRTLAMTFYGDLDVSVIDEMPLGRVPIITAHRNEARRMEVFQFIQTEIDKGRQVYVVFPLIEDSEKLEYKNLNDGFELLSNFFKRPKYQVEIIHGRMKAHEKEMIMTRFKKGEIHILVSTTVIEVGINVPNATVMLIENAESFGLSQLHQLRGRVGRGGDQSYCILMSGQKLSYNGRERIKAMLSTNDGFKLAELDLKLRGPGDIEGTKQSGIADLKIASIVDDEEMLKVARFQAEQILSEDPLLQHASNQPLVNYLNQKSPGKDWSRIS